MPSFKEGKLAFWEISYRTFTQPPHTSISQRNTPLFCDLQTNWHDCWEL